MSPGLTTLNRDPCILPKWVLDSPFSVGAHQSFQILTIVSDYPFGIFQLVLDSPKLSEMSFKFINMKVLQVESDPKWYRDTCDSLRWILDSSFVFGIHHCLQLLTRNAIEGLLTSCYGFINLFSYKDLCDSNGYMIGWCNYDQRKQYFLLRDKT